MSVYEPNSRHLREVLIYFFNIKKSAAEAHRMLSEAYGEAVMSERTCREWYQRFKNGDFQVVLIFLPIFIYQFLLDVSLFWFEVFAE